MNLLLRSSAPPALPYGGAGSRALQPGGFTLIELILVMTMMVILLSITAPSLSRFFRGRTLDSEAKRLLALMRYGQNRAVSEGFPMLLWLDSKEGAYGLQPDSSYLEQETRPLVFKLNPDVQLEVEQPPPSRKLTTVWKGTGGLAVTLPKIRFTPDGFIAETSPERVVLRDRDQAEVWIGQTENGLSYEIQTNQLQRIRR